MAETKTIKVGVFGIGRGSTYMGFNFDPTYMELVAICDKNEPRLEEMNKIRKVTAYTDFDEFIKHPGMEAVFLCNYFHEHTPFAIKALKAGLHVFSECAAIGTLKDGVELCEAVEQSGKVYMMGENYPFTKAGFELKRLYDAGEIGEIMYAEGEYNHAPTGKSPTRWPSVDGPDHWRLWLGPTYYCTHSIGPLMFVTGRQPVSVNARSIRLADVNAHTMGIFKGCRDNGAVSMVTMDNGSVFRLFGTTLPGHSIYYRYHGTRGAMETVRGPGYMGPGSVRVWHEPLHMKEGMVGENTYYPNWPAYPAQANKAGHAGSDFWLGYYFAEAIRNGTQPIFDVYDGCAMSAVGICGWKSALDGGKEVEIPNFRDKAAREKYREDNFCPVHTYPGTRWIPNTTRPGVTLEEQIRLTNECYEYNIPYYSTQPIKH